MPRANRYMLPGNVCHLTHRCHNRSFLFRFARDRTEYRRRLSAAVKEFKLSLIGYCITSNHVHLLVKSKNIEVISRFMQKLEGEFAEYYNIRKHRCGAYWQGRYWCTMVDNGRYLWDCMKYIDLNMVRAGVVNHPSEWEWCGYRELVGEKKRYRFLDLKEILEWFGGSDVEEFRANYSHSISEAIENRDLSREECWTQSIAVGGEVFVRDIGERILNRSDLLISNAEDGNWTVREGGASYN